MRAELIELDCKRFQDKMILKKIGKYGNIEKRKNSFSQLTQCKKV